MPDTTTPGRTNRSTKRGPRYDLPRPVDDYSEEESVVAELRRIDFTGTIWFAASIIAVGLPLAGLLSQGWRPADLPLPAEITWWVGAALTMIGIAGFGWSGCPVLAWPVPIADKQKSITIRGGILLFIVGTVASSIAVLSVPAVGH